VDTDFFRDLQSKAGKMRLRRAGQESSEDSNQSQD
jgi:hypothetical protein